MSNIYVARQPIFNKDMSIYGYELLYRQNQDNFFCEDTDDDLATASLLDNFFLTEFNDLVGEKKGFINFPSNLLLEKVPLMLPKDLTVVEILERVEITQEIVDVCKELKRQGYILALDDFILDHCDDYHYEIFNLVDIIKIEFSNDTIREQVAILKKYKNRIQFLAEKVETREDYLFAKKIGYNLFQGYFFCKPVIIGARSIGTLSNNLILILDELSYSEVDFDYITEIFERDVELSYKLLKMVNLIYYGSTQHIKSIHQALVRLGVAELTRWVHLMVLKGIQNAENAELVKQSIIRGKFLSLYAVEVKDNKNEANYFISGIFSSINVLLNRSMDEILKKLPLDHIVSDTLSGKKTKIREPLEAVMALECAEWDRVDSFIQNSLLSKLVFMELYTSAIKWQRLMV